MTSNILSSKDGSKTDQKGEWDEPSKEITKVQRSFTKIDFLQDLMLQISDQIPMPHNLFNSV